MKLYLFRSKIPEKTTTLSEILAFHLLLQVVLSHHVVRIYRFQDQKFIMTEMRVFVIVGREKWEIPCTSATTFGQLRSSVEKKAGAVEGGMRLLHKGKSFSDESTLDQGNVIDGTKMMAMRTAKQGEAERDIEKLAALGKMEKDVLDIKGHRDRGSAAPRTTSVTSNAILGDPEVDGTSWVLLIKGNSKFRVNIELSSSVLSLKERVSSIQAIGSKSRNIRLLFKGTFLKDTVSLEDCGVKSGVSIMLLFNARHHDEKDDVVEIDSILEKLSALEEKAKSVQSQASHRLLDSVDLSVAKGDLTETTNRLQDNVQSVRTEDSRKPELLRRLEAVDDIVKSL